MIIIMSGPVLYDLLSTSPRQGETLSKHLGANIGCKKIKTFSWHFIEFPDGCVKKHINASRPSEHPAQGGKCQNA